MNDFIKSIEKLKKTLEGLFFKDFGKVLKLINHKLEGLIKCFLMI